MLSPIQQRWLNNSAIPARFHSVELATLEPYTDDTTVRGLTGDWIKAVIDGRIICQSGVGLTFIGKPGHGKTTLAAATLMALIRAPGFEGRPLRPVYFGYYPEILAMVKKTFGPEPVPEEALIDAMFGRGSEPIQVLVIDDLGKEHRTASHWAENFFDHLLRTRYDRGLPTIITTNVPLKEWGSAYGESMQSFAHEALTPISIISDEGDRRR